MSPHARLPDFSKTCETHVSLRSFPVIAFPKCAMFPCSRPGMFDFKGCNSLVPDMSRTAMESSAVARGTSRDRLRRYGDDVVTTGYIQTTRTKCCFCDGNLFESSSKATPELAIVVGPGKPKLVQHLKKRCSTRSCETTYCCSYAVRHGQKINIVDGDGGTCQVLMLSGKFGFSNDFLQSHVHRVFRGAISTSAEAENIATRFAGTGLKCPHDRKVREQFIKHVYMCCDCGVCRPGRGG